MSGGGSILAGIGLLFAPVLAPVLFPAAAATAAGAGLATAGAASGAGALLGSAAAPGAMAAAGAGLGAGAGLLSGVAAPAALGSALPAAAATAATTTAGAGLAGGLAAAAAPGTGILGSLGALFRSPEFMGKAIGGLGQAMMARDEQKTLENAFKDRQRSYDLPNSAFVGGSGGLGGLDAGGRPLQFSDGNEPQQRTGPTGNPMAPQVDRASGVPRVQSAGQRQLPSARPPRLGMGQAQGGRPQPKYRYNQASGRIEYS